MNHDPKQAIADLQVILSNPSKKIGFLFGAGISLKDESKEPLIPGVQELTDKIISTFSPGIEKDAIQKMRDEIGEKKFNIESLLTKITEKEVAAGDEKLCGMTQLELKGLRKKIEDQIKTIISVHKSNFSTRDLAHYKFAQWIKNADRNSSVEIFTLNYDYLLEIALEKYEVPYFDGFIGNYEAFFYPEWVEDTSAAKDWTKLWKLHGSLGWEAKDDNRIVRTSSEKGEGIIFPSFLKYDHSRKQPYLSYIDRLSSFLKQEDSVLFISGYSFGDEHINDIILSSLSRNRSAHVFVLKFGDLDEADLLFAEIAKKNSKVSVYAKKNAVIGCKLGKWKLSVPGDYVPSFEEDKTEAGAIPTGYGNITLGDFSSFAEFLSSFNRFQGK